MRRNRGFALLMTLFIVLILGTLVVDISYSARVSASIAGNHRDRLQGYYLGLSGIKLSLLRLKVDDLADKLMGRADHLRELQWALDFSYPSGLSLIATMAAGNQQQELTEEQQKSLQKIQDVGYSFSSEIRDEASRININGLLLDKTKKPNGSYLMLRNLLYLKKFQRFFRDTRPEETINNLVDWIDADSESLHISGGMEDGYYQTLQPPYHAKNGPFFSLPEVRLVRDIDLDLLEALKDFVTVYPFTLKGFVGRDFGRININTAPLEILAAILDPNEVGQPMEVAKKMIEFRDKTTFKKADEFFAYAERELGLTKEAIFPDVRRIVDIKSDVFRLISRAEVGGTVVVVEAVVDRSKAKPVYYYWKVD